MSVAHAVALRLTRDGGGAAMVVEPEAEIGAGGQARIFAVGRDGRLVAKVYHHPTPGAEAKLRAMLRHPPCASTEVDGVEMVWPLDLLRDADGGFRGLLLPRVAERHRVFEVYNPATRRQRAPLFHPGILHRTARNVAEAFRVLHAAGYVVGDVNESNLLVADDGRIAVIDTDSFQVRDPSTGAVFPCPVARPEFTPPELHGRDLARVVRLPEHDAFGLGVVVFHLLMEGTHPFAGRVLDVGDPPSIQERIARGLFPHAAAAAGRIVAPRTAPPLEVLHPALRELVVRCFADGGRDPAARPPAGEWVVALEEAEAALLSCAANPQHRFGGHLGACPWCARTALLRGRDPFPTPDAVARGEHLPAHRSRAPRPAPRAPRAPAAPPPRRQAAAPRPMATARTGLATARNPWIWSALAAAALFLLVPVGELTLVVPVLLVLGWYRALTRGGRQAPFAAIGSVAAVLMVVLGFSEYRPTPGPFQNPAEYLERVSPAVPLALSPPDLHRKPALLDTAAFVEAFRDLAPPDDIEGANLRFVVDIEGGIDPATVLFEPASAAAAATLAERLRTVRFQPGWRAGWTARAAMGVPVEWQAGVATPRLDMATWNEGVDTLPAAQVPAPAVGNTGDDVDPRLSAQFRSLLAGYLERHYPDHLRDAGIGERVVLWLFVDEQGRVQQVRVIEARDEAFVRVAVDAFSHVRFEPARRGGEPVAVWLQIPVSFQVR